LEELVEKTKEFPDGRLDAKNAALYCGLSVKTMAIKRCQGTGPTYVKRGRIFYFKDDLDRWLSAGRVNSTAQKARLVSAEPSIITKNLGTAHAPLGVLLSNSSTACRLGFDGEQI
jgi:hypothetical protein